MKCEKCGKKIKKGEEVCPECGNGVLKTSEENTENTEEVKKKSEKKYKVIFIAMISVVLIAVLIFLGSVVLPNTGNDFWTRIPEYSIERTELEAGVECDALELIEITDEGDRVWEVTIVEDNIDTSKLGTYIVEYLFTSNKTERKLKIEYEVAEGELPEIEQIDTEIEYGRTLQDVDGFEVINIKDYEYEIDDSNCDYNVLGTYPVHINLFNSRGVDETIEYEIDVVDTQLPTIDCSEKIMVMKGEEADLLEFASASDNYDGDITDKIKFSGKVSFDTPGSYEVTYKVSDTSGNEKQTKMDVIVMASIGDTVDINNWTIKAEKSYFSNRINDRGYWDYMYWYYDAADGNTFFVINMRTINNSDEKDCFADEMVWPEEEIIQLKFGDEYSYTQQTYELRNDITNSDEQYYVKAGSTGYGKLYFEVSEDLKDYEGDIILEVKSADSSDEEKAVYIL